MKGRIADLPLEERRALEAERQREIDEGLTRGHLHITTYLQSYLAVQFDRILRAGPALAAMLRGE